MSFSASGQTKLSAITGCPKSRVPLYITLTLSRVWSLSSSAEIKISKINHSKAKNSFTVKKEFIVHRCF